MLLDLIPFGFSATRPPVDGRAIGNERAVEAVPTGGASDTPRPQGNGQRRGGDREVLTAITFVATTGCTEVQIPPVFGPSGPTAHRHFTEWSRARV